ncbi:MAG: DHA1 family tetracycline resistance protein-like MFS transporter [Candidatus Azotimanducaceae bacterium]|jgi:DHA1 family tetracycline resistance protein-like MFS transporter
MNRYALLFIFFTALLDSIGFGIIMPVIPGLLMEVSGGDLSSSARFGGLLMFCFAITQFICSPIIGNLSDRFGRRPVLLFSLFVVGVNYLIMGFTTSLALLFVGRVISGIGAATFSTCNAYIADVSPEDKRAQNFGLMGAAFGMGFIIGPVIGGFLGEYGSRMPFFAAGILSFANMTFGYFVLQESLAPANRRPFSLARANPIGTLLQLKAFPIVLGIIGVSFLYNLGHHVLPSTWSFFSIEKFNWSPREIGYSLGFIGICMVAVQGFLIRWVLPRTGLRMAGIIGMLFTIVAFSGYAAANASWMMYVAMIPGALGALAGPAMQGIASNQVGASQQGELQGGLSSVVSLTSIISPIAMTQTFGYFTSNAAPIYFPGAAFVLASLLTVASLLMFIRATRNLEPVVVKGKL